MLEAACHCGVVKIAVRRRPSRLVSCNCRICHRYGALWLYGTDKTISVNAGESETQAYEYGPRKIRFHHCKHCGCVTHYRRTDDSGVIAVNARMIDRSDIDGIRIRHFDGADTWRFLN